MNFNLLIKKNYIDKNKKKVFAQKHVFGKRGLPTGFEVKKTEVGRKKNKY